MNPQLFLVVLDQNLVFPIGCSRLRASVESLLLFKESPRCFKAKLAYTEARSDRRPKGFNLKAQGDFVSWT